jgi:glutamyl-tRNA reductase
MSLSDQIHVVSFNHRNTSVEGRDLIALSADQIGEVVQSWAGVEARELAILSTCNRTEFYGCSRTRTKNWHELVRLVESVRGKDLGQLPEPLILEADDAANHLFRVAASMESMALGEDQILTQVKGVHRQVLDAPQKMPVLDRLYQFAIRAGKRVRTETALCRGTVSISSASVQLAKKIFGDLTGLTILIVGAGETARMTAEQFQVMGCRHFVVCNRDFERGERFAKSLSGRCVPLDDIEASLQLADVAVFATSSPTHLFGREMAVALAKRRRSGPLFVIDISSPRNVEPEVGRTGEIFLYNIDDLQAIVDENLKTRSKEIPRAQTIVDELVDEWNAWMMTRRVYPTISELVRYFDAVRGTELDRIGTIDSPAERERLDAFSRSLVKKLLHYPIVHLRSGAEGDSFSEESVTLVRQLFQLGQHEDD